MDRSADGKKHWFTDAIYVHGTTNKNTGGEKNSIIEPNNTEKKIRGSSVHGTTKQKHI